MIKIESYKIGKEGAEISEEVAALSSKYLIPTTNILCENIIRIKDKLSEQDISEEKKAIIFYNIIVALIIGIIQASKLKIEDAVYVSKDVYETLADQQFYINYEKVKECDSFHEYFTQKLSRDKELK
jgi:hypothetical protein